MFDQEVEAMFSLDELKQTQYFQDVREEAKLEKALKLEIEQVKQIQNDNK